MHVAVNELAGLGLGVLWTPKILADGLPLAVGPSEVRGSRSRLSIHCQLLE